MTMTTYVLNISQMEGQLYLFIAEYNIAQFFLYPALNLIGHFIICTYVSLSKLNTIFYLSVSKRPCQTTNDCTSIRDVCQEACTKINGKFTGNKCIILIFYSVQMKIMEQACGKNNYNCSPIILTYQAFIYFIYTTNRITPIIHQE